mmetsp:Transcript_44028/g.86355  ORF Transcript_44028/g.86355 Transcript_44028/m.86355 type:complete len:156 (-) Transcript_44028:255-722(-)
MLFYSTSASILIILRFLLIVQAAQSVSRISSIQRPGAVELPQRRSLKKCDDEVDYCELMMVDGEMVHVCDWLETMRTDDRRIFKKFCDKKTYWATVPDEQDACIYLENSPYKKAYKDQCDKDNTFDGDTDDRGLPIIKIKFYEVCQRTCENCKRL